MRRGMLPESFLEAMKALLGEELDAYLDSFDQEKWQGLRRNSLKISRERWEEISPFALEPVPWTEDGYYYRQEDRPARDPYYYAGLYYLQEPSAMTPGAFLPVEPGDRVLDLCAAPGGKSTQLGARLRGEGLLVSNDVSNSRAKALLKNLELFGIPNICVTSETPERLSQVFRGFFDKVLIDAPCSGEGMFRKDEAMIRAYRERGPETYVPLQREILRQGAAMLKPGGCLLYSTCTFDRREDEENISWILEEEPELELEPLPLFEGAADGIGLSGCLRLFPHKLRGEGHFLALLRKRTPETDALPEPGKRVPETENVFRQNGAALRSESRRNGSSAKDSVDPEQIPEMASLFRQAGFDPEPSRLRIIQDQVYYLPGGFPAEARLRYLRTGLLLGTCKKNRFEPSQAWAMTLTADSFSPALSLSREDERVIRYLKGETVCLEDGEEDVRGWCLICVDGFGLGFAKGQGRTLKNKYYPGWRWQ